MLLPIVNAGVYCACVGREAAVHNPAVY